MTPVSLRAGQVWKIDFLQTTYQGVLDLHLGTQCAWDLLHGKEYKAPLNLRPWRFLGAELHTEEAEQILLKNPRATCLVDPNA